MKNFSFNGITKPFITATRGSSRPSWGPIERELLEVTKRAGAHLIGTKTKPRPITINVVIKAKDISNLQKLKEELADWLFTDVAAPLTLDDEPDRTYYAMVEGTLNLDELVDRGKGTIYFICPDPYKYGPELTANFPTDAVTVTNHGTVEAEPIFEMEVTRPITFAMIQNQDEEYMMLGRPADEDGFEEIVDTKTSVLYENGSTLGTWSVAPHSMVDVNFIDNIDGQMTTDGAGIRADGYGTGNLQHGPAIFKELPEAIQDFEIESTFDIISSREEENWRMGIYFHDENMNNLGHLGIKDNSRIYKRRVGLGRAGHYRGGGPANGNVIGDSSWINNNARDTTLMYLRVKREGQNYSFYIGEWRGHRHVHTWEGVYRDMNNEFQGQLKYITLAITKYQDRPNPSRLRINSVEVFELKTATQDQTPYIAYPGDIITFDHKDDELLINGEDRTDLKDFGGSYFKLAKGQNQLVIHPSNSFNTSIQYRERYR